MENSGESTWGIKEGTFNLKAEADGENWTGFSQMKRTGEDR